MNHKARNSSLRTLIMSVSALAFYCSFASGVAAGPHYYQYAEPDDETTAPMQQHYTYVAPAPDSTVDPAYYASILRHAAKTKQDPALTYPPIESVHARANVPAPAAQIASSAPMVVAQPIHTQVAEVPLNQAVVSVIQTQLASAALVSQMSVANAAAFTSTEARQLQPNAPTNTATRNLAVLAPAAGSSHVQGVQVASAADLPPLQVAAMPPITTLPTTIRPPARPVADNLPTVPPVVKATPLLSANAGLSEQSKEILENLPAEKNHNKKKHPFSIDHARKNPLEDTADVKRHEGLGIKISIRNPKTDTNQMLENAYEALIAGNQQEAVEIYKQVLDDQPQNKLALFGLATTYHRAGQTQLARPLYGKLLAIDPRNVEGLNNFLVLLSDEDPREALSELHRLEQTHPGFSPVAAQEAVIYEKMGQLDKATIAMDRAIALSPENLKYRYDMAIILDKQGAWGDAAGFYQQLLTASDRGEKIPTKPEEIQERLTFIRSNKPRGAS